MERMVHVRSRNARVGSRVALSNPSSTSTGQSVQPGADRHRRVVRLGPLGTHTT